jgi:transcription initiation factor IIE alpha subunit
VKNRRDKETWLKKLWKAAYTTRENIFNEKMNLMLTKLSKAP